MGTVAVVVPRVDAKDAKQAPAAADQKMVQALPTHGTNPALYPTGMATWGCWPPPLACGSAGLGAPIRLIAWVVIRGCRAGMAGSVVAGRSPGVGSASPE